MMADECPTTDQNIRISPETMRKLSREDEGIKLPDGNYYGSLMVFHHLHCLVRSTPLTP